MNNITQAITQYWNSASAFEQSGLAVLATIACFYLVRYVIILRLEKLTRNTDNDLDDRLVHFLKQFLWLVAIVIGLISILKINNIKVGPVLAGAGIFGIAIGLAAQETLSDIISGIFLIADRPIR
ncbi:MAG: small-conductance mechanosensitive channel, partial [Arenicella sp.]